MALAQRIETLAGARFLKYATGGAIATLADWTSFSALTLAGLDYKLSLVLSLSCGAATSFLLNKVYIFKSRSRDLARQLAVFLAIGVAMLGVSMALLYFLHGAMGLPGIPSRIAVTLLLLPANYALHGSITFHERLRRQP